MEESMQSFGFALGATKTGARPRESVRAPMFRQ
jgi:hypothetical protein